MLELIKDNSCILNTQILNLKSGDGLGIKITKTKGFYPPPTLKDAKSSKDPFYKY